MEIGPDVPEDVSCFQIAVGAVQCLGRQGATEIMVLDNDCKLPSTEGIKLIESSRRSIMLWHHQHTVNSCLLA